MKFVYGDLIICVLGVKEDDVFIGLMWGVVIYSMNDFC